MYGFRRRDPDDPNSEVSYEVIGGIQIHAGGTPPNSVFNWSDGCVVICGGISGIFRQLAGHYTYTFDEETEIHSLRHRVEGLIEQLEGTSHTVQADGTYVRDDFDEDDSEWGRNRMFRANRTISINVIVWNAWALAQFYHYRRIGGGFTPVIPMGAHDPPGVGMRGWVRFMQFMLRDKIVRGILWYKHLKLIVGVLPSARLPTFITPDGHFGTATLEQLRKFQKISADILENSQLNLDIAGTVNVSELRWERDEWLCGPETWKLLLSHKFKVSKTSSIDDRWKTWSPCIP